MFYNPSKTTWLNPNIEYIFNTEIIEYDISDAGFNLIKQYKLLPSEKIKELEMLGKGKERHIVIGKLQGSDKEFSKKLLDKFAEIRRIFIDTNQLSDNDIISVKKDAIFTIGPCKRTRFGNITFVEKNHYSSYIRFSTINDMEIYYSSDEIDIKGMADNTINRHRLYMLDFLKNVISLLEVRDSKVKRYILKFIDDYKRLELDDEYYLEFNNVSRNINPRYNYMNILIPLVQIITREIE